jgi:O-antigen ligase/tetratricopeptide (TPR) repeat protein
MQYFKGITMAGVYGGLLLPLVFIPSVIFPFVFSKLIFFQIVVGLTFPAYLALAWMDKDYRPKAHLLYLAITAYFAALFLSVVFGVDPMRAWWGNQERMNGLFTLLHFFAWLTMAIGVLRTWEQWRRFLNYEILLSGIMAIVAILQKLNPNLLMFTAGPRVGGLLDNPIYMAAYQIFNLFFLALLFIKVSSRNARLFYAAIAFLDIIAFLLAQSRGALVGLAAGLFAFGAYYGLFTPHRKVRIGLLTALVALMGMYGLMFAFRETPLLKGTPIYRLTDLHGTVSTRLIAWDIAWKGFLERPLTGWGLDSFHILFNAKYNPHSLRFGSYETWFDRAHNTVMDVLSMTGLVGFMTFASIFVTIFIVTWRAWKRRWIDLPVAAILFSLPLAYFVQNLFVFDHPAGFSMSFLLYALIIAATRGEFVGKKEPEEGAKLIPTPNVEARHAAPWIAYAVLQLLLLLLVWRTSVLPYRASTLAIRSNTYISSNPAQGLEYAKQAADIWTPYLDEQSFLLSRNLISMIGSGQIQKIPQWQEMYALAKRLSEEEIRRHPRNTHPLYIFARLTQEVAPLINAEGIISEQMYLRSIETSPKRQQLHYGLARLYMMVGQVDVALEIMKRVRDFDPELAEGYWNYGITLMYDKGDVDAGAAEIVQVLRKQYPYQFKDPREYAVYVEAATHLKDEEALLALLRIWKDYPQPTVEQAAQLVLRLDQTGMDGARDKYLEFIEKTWYPNIGEEFAKALLGAAVAPSIPDPLSPDAVAEETLQNTTAPVATPALNVPATGPRK